LLRRGAFLLAVLAIALFACGCEPKLYYFSFEDEQQLENDEGAWMVSIPGNYAFGADGISLNNTVIYGPHKYKGDFKFTLEFKLDTGSGTPSFALYMTEEPIYAVPVADMLGITLSQMGETFESFIIFDKGGGNSYGQSFEMAIPGLVDVGDNALYITKTDNHINFKLNDSVLFDYDLQYYPSEWICPSLAALTPSESFIIRSFSVEYKGSREEM
jgi:hypothetical protein